MADSITISKKAPKLKSMQYAFLREEGIKHIQKLSGKIWTDYNIHDPGITLLEVLSYAITELGYRSSYSIKDLITQAPNEVSDIKNFFTARQILPNSAVTINDYRKIMIDVEIRDPNDDDCEHVGVRNAWLQKAQNSGVPIYVHKDDSQLQYEPDPTYTGPDGSTEQSSLDIGILYDILLEFEKCEAYGDLNENSIVEEHTVESHPLDELIEGLVIKIKVDFPRWDNKEVDWEDVLSIKNEVQNITISFLNEPNGYEFEYEIVNNNVKLKGLKITSSDSVNIPGIEIIETALNNFIYHDNDSLTSTYLEKIGKINKIIEKVKARLNANRNLCEDFVQFKALRVEKIAVCADIELEAEANVELVQAQIYHEIAKFLSPPVIFYSLDEMLDKCKTRHELSIIETNNTNKYFLVQKKGLSDLLSKDDTIYISGSTSNDGEYTVKSVTQVQKGVKVIVKEDIASDLLTEGELLWFNVKEESDCLTVDEIFEGPALEHGFIDNNELALADRKKYIHVSDLIQIIMKIDGVVALKSIQIANLPQDNENGDIESISVKWCMKLAFDKNYVPRLSILDSKITFYKSQLPFKASATKVDKLIDTLEAKERIPRLYNVKLDFEVPRGTYKDPEKYNTIQNDFPITYGVGEEGLPQGRTSTVIRKAQSKQLKGFLMFFDQLFANFFSQLAHVKDLFSMNAEKDQSGKYIIERTYYTQPLFDIPDIDELYVDKAGHLVALNDIAEDEKLFGERKNKFLNHLLGRFAEEFTDYALLTFKITGEDKAPEELIDDKLTFLNAYPITSSRRGTAFDHQEPCKLWHVDNISGIERRVSFLAGIAPVIADRLVFGTHFGIVENSGAFSVEVSDDGANVLLTSSHDSQEEAAMALEIMVINGIRKENYTIISEDGTNYKFTLSCDIENIARSKREDYPDGAVGGEADQTINLLVQIFTSEFYSNIESNRNNLACPLNNYFETAITTDLVPDPPTFTISFDLYQKPFDFITANKILEGSYTYESDAKAQVDIISVDLTKKKVIIDGNIRDKLAQGDILTIVNSVHNDGNYTVKSASETGDETEIEVDEVIPSDSVPLGELLYNTISENELLQEAEKELSNFLWELIKNAHKEDQYVFDPSSDPFSSPYVFKINNRFGEVIGTSVGKDFNEALADEFNNLISGQITINGSSGNDGTYDVSLATTDGPNLKLALSPVPPSSQADGILSFTESYSYVVDQENNAFVVNTDLTQIFEKEDSIVISGSSSNDGTYQLYDINFDNTNTILKVDEKIPSDDDSGEFHYSKDFNIVGIANSNVIIMGGYDIKAVQTMVKFIDQKFFSHEGFHVVEHVLLRPQIKGLHFVEADQTTLNGSLTDLGELGYDKAVDIFSASKQTNLFRVNGDLRTEINRLPSTDLASTFKVTGTNFNDGEYKVKSVQYDSAYDRTAIEVIGNIDADIPSTNAYGEITYKKHTPVISITGTELKIKVDDLDVLALEPGEIISIAHSTNGINDGRYKIREVLLNGAQQELTICCVESEVKDTLLDIVVDEDKCDACKIEDPYTCIASVILPHWQGRFDNMDFKRFFETQIRMETPAHVFLNICWVSCNQMAEFETKYKAWMIENTRLRKDYARLSAVQNDMVDILTRLRNVYPVGTLYDCEKDDTLDNAIILDNSVLGNA